MADDNPYADGSFSLDLGDDHTDNLDDVLGGGGFGGASAQALADADEMLGLQDESLDDLTGGMDMTAAEREQARLHPVSLESPMAGSEDSTESESNDLIGLLDTPETKATNQGGMPPLPAMPPVQPLEKQGCCSLQIFRKYFNVNTAHVKQRMRTATMPFAKPAPFLTLIGTNPDLYIPFWAATTLIFAIGVSANLSSYFETANAKDWHSDINIPSVAMTFVYSYTTVFAVTIWGVLQFLGVTWVDPESQREGVITLPACLCMVGYNLLVWTPVVLLCILPYDWLQWIWLLSATGHNSYFVITELKPHLAPLDTDPGELGPSKMGKGSMALGVVVVGYLLFGVCLKALFF